jgi:hypothetical protein
MLNALPGHAKFLILFTCPKRKTDQSSFNATILTGSTASVDNECHPLLQVISPAFLFYVFFGGYTNKSTASSAILPLS